MKTLIGRLSKKEGTFKSHHGTFGEDDLEEMKRKLKWENQEPFHVIPMVYRFGLLNLSLFSKHFLSKKILSQTCNILLQGNADSIRPGTKIGEGVVL